MRYVGVSNFAAWQLCKAMWTQDVKGFKRLEAIQSPYSLVVRGIESEIMPLCADQDVGVVTFSPLGAGFLTGKYRKGEPTPPGTRFDQFPDHERLFFSDRNFEIVETLRSKAESLGVPMPQLAFAWAMRQPGISSVLAGARTAAHVQQAIDAEAIDLDETTLAELGA